MRAVMLSLFNLEEKIIFTNPSHPTESVQLQYDIFLHKTGNSRKLTMGNM